jgi:hypothetical protein
VTLSARFVAENAGTDAIWRGVRRVAGRVTLHGFAGMRGPQRSWRDATVDLEGTWAEEMRRSLAAAFVDRLRIWAQRDFGGRDAFDEAFRRARVTARADAPGLYDVVNGPCSTLEIREGKVVSWDPPTLVAGRLGYARVGDRLVHTSLTAGTATSTVTWTDLGGGWIFPATMRFDRTLDPEWGPETVTLSDVRWAPERPR